MSRLRSALVAALVAAGAGAWPAGARAQEPPAKPAVATSPTETPAQRDARMGWWRDARFGLFVHWGAYAVPAGLYHGQRTWGTGEWIMNTSHVPIAEYEGFARRFNPQRFDADAWVRAAKNAGMKYIVITSKHHEGFSMYGTKLTPYNIVDYTPFKRDPLRELAAAAKRQGVKLGFYYSITDWHHPDAQAPNYPEYNSPSKVNPNFHRYVETYLKPQLRELITGYDPAILWFDGDWIDDWTDADAHEVYDYVRKLKPGILVNNRIGKGRTGMEGFGATLGDFGTPEQQVPPQGLPGVDWESCITMNDTWGYKSYDDNWKDSHSLIRMLVDVASKGGNLLLNVGPKADGTIPSESLARMAEMGAWLRANGASIYGTSASPFAQQPTWGRFTRKGTTLYAHVFDWPKDSTLVLPGLKEGPVRAFLVADGAPVRAEVTAGGVALHLPHVPSSTIDAVVAIETRDKVSSTSR